MMINVSSHLIQFLVRIIMMEMAMMIEFVIIKMGKI